MMKRFITISLTIAFVAAVGFSMAGNSDLTASLFDGIDNFFKNFPSQTSTTTKQVSEQNEEPLYKPAQAYEDAVVEAVDKARPSVVSIAITQQIQTIERCQYDPFGNLPDEFRSQLESYEFYQPCPGETREFEVGGGSGFIVSSDGLIVTNKHVVRNEEASYTVVTNKGEKYEAEVVAKDPVQDIAILKIDAEGLNPAELGSSGSLKLGQTAIAIGNALGEFRNTVSVGVVSGLSRNITAAGASGMVERINDVIQTDAAINRGNSGGPLLNLRGEVIGVSTAIAQGAQNIGFAIPIDRVKWDIESVRETGKIKTPFLGVRYVPINKEIAENQNLDIERGALVRGSDRGPAVVPNSAADKAGIQAEDIILEIGGKKITHENPLNSIIQKFNVGDRVKIKIRRGDETLTLSAKLGERPDESN